MTNSIKQEQNHANRISRNLQQGGMLRPARLLHPDHLLCADGLLRADRLLHPGSLLRASGLLRPDAGKSRLR